MTVSPARRTGQSLSPQKAESEPFAQTEVVGALCYTLKEGGLDPLVIGKYHLLSKIRDFSG
jgi:hypothetical protein